MSGGSWDYVYGTFDEVADRLHREKDPMRRALGRRISLISKALHDIEWNDSGDGADEKTSIARALGKEGKIDVLNLLKEDAENAKNALSDFLKSMGNK